MTKNKMRFFLSCAISLFVCSGCGKFLQNFDRLPGSGTTEVHLNSPAANPLMTFQPFASPYDGKFMFYVVGVNGTNHTATASVNALSNIAGVSVVVPNGQYRVLAVGWQSSGSPNYYPVEGNSGCGAANGGNPITFGGGSTTVSIDISTANCLLGTTNTVFSDSTYSDSTGFGQLMVNLCNGLTGSSCTASDSTLAGNYMEFTLDGYDDSGGARVALPAKGLKQFGCGGVVSNYVSTAKRVPVGSSVSGAPTPVAVSLVVHPDAACSSTPVRTFSFPKGIVNGLNGVAGKSAITFASGITTLNINTQ